MKPEKREEARRLRREGLAINDICRRIHVAKSSVSVWVRDIELTPEQKAALEKQHYAYRAQTNGGHTNATKFRTLREQYQQEGRQKAREKDPLHVAGCMLYWGEGRKHKNHLVLTNSDPTLLKFFVDFLKNTLQVQEKEITLHINCYLNNEQKVEEIEQYWVNALQLPQSCLRHTIANALPASSQQRGRKLVYGVCQVRVDNTRLVQHIFGAIQEYAGIEKPEWLM
ncbi:MAG: hypothetical protein HZC41_20920 [Chloroflexi bacterium]|nr:hypothetical protein [Chloroflexota bacterium]